MTTRLRRPLAAAARFTVVLSAAACSSAAAKAPCERDATQKAWLQADSAFRAEMHAAFGAARATLSASAYRHTVQAWRVRQDSMRGEWQQVQVVADSADVLTGCVATPHEG